MKLKTCLLSLCLTFAAINAFASGYGVFTQGASGLGQANAVVAHTTGPSSLYFNPALINDLPGRQVEVGTTAIYADREIKLDSTGQTEDADNGWNFPSTFYYTHEANEKITAGIGAFFPFGLSSEWDNDYEGRYIGTKGELFSMNINPAVSWRVNERLHLAGGLDFVYIDADLRAMINQTGVTFLVNQPGLPDFGVTPGEDLPDIEQKLEGDGWGMGFNLGALYKVTDRVSVGAAYRSEVDVDFDYAKMKFNGVDPRLGLLFPESDADVDITLPAQFVAGVAFQATNDLVVEVGCRWEDWDSTDDLTADLQRPFLFTQSSIIIPRDWRSTWAYNIGGQYRINDTIALNAGYLYGENPVPASTFEPIIPDSDSHLFTIGTDLNFGQWTISGAFGYEHHDDRNKSNDRSDPLGSSPSSANGKYSSSLYLVGLSLGYKF